MGKLNYRQIHNLPADVRAHGITNVYTAPEIDYKLAHLADGTIVPADVSVLKQSGELPETKVIQISIPEFNKDLDTVMLYVGGLLMTEGVEFSIVGTTLTYLLNNWIDGMAYDIIVIKSTVFGATGELKSFNERQSITSDTNMIEIRDIEFNPDTDIAFLFVGGILQTEGIQYTFDASTRTFYKISGTWAAGQAYDIRTLRSIHGVYDPNGGSTTGLIDGDRILPGTLEYIAMSTAMLESIRLSIINIVNAGLVNDDIIVPDPGTAYTHPGTHPVSMITGAATTTDIAALNQTISTINTTIQTLSNMVAAKPDVKTIVSIFPNNASSMVINDAFIYEAYCQVTLVPQGNKTGKWGVAYENGKITITSSVVEPNEVPFIIYVVRQSGF